MLSTIDLSKSLTKQEYIQDLIRYQLQLRALAYQLYVQKRPLVIVYEGWDAGGKGGNIKRITEKLDPRGYEVYPIAAPQGEARLTTTCGASGGDCKRLTKNRSSSSTAVGMAG